MTKTESAASYWRQSVAARNKFSRIQDHAEADAIVVGAGITGLTAALCLKQAGRKVIVLEADKVASGASGQSTAHVTAVPDVPLDELVERFGVERARAAVAVAGEAIDTIAQWTRRHTIDCDFRRIKAAKVASRAEDVALLEREVRAAEQLGLEASLDSDAAIPFGVAPALQFERAARFDPVRYLRGLAKLVHGDGSRVCEHTRCKEPTPAETERGLCAVQTPRGTVRAPAVIVATHAPYLGLFPLVGHLTPQMTYVLAARLARRVPDALYWDTGQPYHYIRRASGADPDLVLVGGCDSLDTPGEEGRVHLTELSLWVRERFPGCRIEQGWSGRIYGTHDGLPYIGAMPGLPGVYEASGFAGCGIAYGTAAGMLLADVITGRPNPAAAVFDPGRRARRSAPASAEAPAVSAR